MHVAQFAMFAVITLAAWKVASRLIGQNSRLQRSQQRIDG
jgi:type II secretory pathway component PulJ